MVRTHKKKSDQSEVPGKKVAQTSRFYGAHTAVDSLFMVLKAISRARRETGIIAAGAVVSSRIWLGKKVTETRETVSDKQF